MLTTHHEQKTIHELFTMYKQKGLNVGPAVQRQSVWSAQDRQLFGIRTSVGAYPFEARV